MSKFSNFVWGTVLGAAVGFVAGSFFVSDEKIADLKRRVKDNDTVQDLKKKYDNGTEVVKNQLSSFSKSVEDDSELKDFDDIVIDDSEGSNITTDSAENSVADIDNSEIVPGDSSVSGPKF